MRSFSYTRAQDVKKAVSEVSSHEDAKFIAGGTNLLDLMKYDIMKPRHLVDITRLEMKSIEETEGGGLRLDALVSNADTAYHPLVEERYPLLSHAILAGATAQLRNKATDGGNLLQRTRCYYFYDTTTLCNKREPGTGCSAITGYNRNHAILGHSQHCIATHPSDMAVALAALEATIQVSGPEGERSIPIADFHRLPGDKPEKDTNLAENEIVTAIELPKKGFARHYTYLKNRDRASFAFALVSVAAALELDGDTIQEARIALGGVAHKPWRKPEAEALLQGKEVSREHFQQVADAYLEGAEGFQYNEFKIELARRSIVRALMQAAKTDQ
ncbi:FAD binding domain-containing protein [Nafulsella turpanensis]|uniref:FAD binding domain-containing protein n=1 Tax=Nafulsella turpanensis TaxID=1265690 RepID=UPI00034498C1|nr:xanthine dehydrogenase family protein subunit M [Nafulsella turpanensis]